MNTSETTAESGSFLPHAWFAGYTMANENTGLPDIAIAVILENEGEGSDYAAPVFKRIVETYYYGAPQTFYWFESEFGVTRTPTPIGGIPTILEDQQLWQTGLKFRPTYQSIQRFSIFGH